MTENIPITITPYSFVRGMFRLAWIVTWFSIKVVVVILLLYILFVLNLFNYLVKKGY